MEYRTAMPGERDDFMDIAHLAFGFDLERLIPKVYDTDRDPSAYHKVAVDGRGRIRSQIAVLPETHMVASQTLKIGFVGLVSTHPRERGQGHMKRLMELHLAEGQGQYDLMALYGQRQRYEHFGFTQGGIRLRHIVETANVRHALSGVDSEGIAFAPFSETVDADRFAFALNQKRLAYVVRPQGDMRKILVGFGQKAWEILARGRIIGYLTTNSGDDEITEIGLSDATDLSRVIKAFLAFSRKQSISILMPEYEVAQNETLLGFAEVTRTEPADMYRIVDFANVLKAYLSLKLASSGLSPGVFSAVLAGQPVTATVDASGVSVARSALPNAVQLDRSRAQTLLLSNYGKYAKVAAPEGWFPLPLFWHYADRF
jgi:hypothetical protein